ncbi:hypothetical protein [Stakelama saccharophila]|uniref:Transmembrane protein n=1 Tax=Stakelama saccharophila TaxID=3075605 RepID=A0ABZ0B722_9SPHN|nr:hypothetical protein [Stakelama sp. W311]WNO53058.1 hypothetical protein RPR59_11410 [Stakelama sp. W311]
MRGAAHRGLSRIGTGVNHFQAERKCKQGVNIRAMSSQPSPSTHPFRERLRIREKRNALRPRVRAHDDDSDVRLFALSFLAFFVCFYTFLI